MEDKIFTLIEVELLKSQNVILAAPAGRELVAERIHKALTDNFLFVEVKDFKKLVELKEFMKQKVEELGGRY